MEGIFPSRFPPSDSMAGLAILQYQVLAGSYVLCDADSMSRWFSDKALSRRMVYRCVVTATLGRVHA
jgi:hypothetical protein